MPTHMSACLVPSYKLQHLQKKLQQLQKDKGHILQKNGHNLRSLKSKNTLYKELLFETRSLACPERQARFSQQDALELIRAVEDLKMIYKLHEGILELREQISTESLHPYSLPFSFSLKYRSSKLGVRLSSVKCGLMVMAILEGAPHRSNIREADVIIGVNCQRFDKHSTMEERMDILRKALCPMVVHFERDSNGAGLEPRTINRTEQPQFLQEEEN